MRRIIFALMLCLLNSALAGPVNTTTILLKSGAKIEVTGKVLQTADSLIIETASGSTTFPMDRVDQVIRGNSHKDENRQPDYRSVQGARTSGVGVLGTRRVSTGNRATYEVGRGRPDDFSISAWHPGSQ